MNRLLAVKRRVNYHHHAMTRHCIIFTGKNQLEVIDEPMPALKPGEILIETNRSLISTGTELICLHRLMPSSSP